MFREEEKRDGALVSSRSCLSKLFASGQVKQSARTMRAFATPVSAPRVTLQGHALLKSLGVLRARKGVLAAVA